MIRHPPRFTRTAPLCPYTPVFRSCVLLEDRVTSRGERAKYMGRDGSYTIVPNSNTADNVTSDYFWKFVATDAIVANLKATALPEVIEGTRGYVAGFNRYIHELKAGERSDEHTSELQSLLTTSYACLCLKEKNVQ